MRIRVAGLVVLVLLPLVPLAAQSEYSEPQLRLLQDFHSDVVNDSDLHEEAGLFVTASDDGTVRVWELAEGELLHVLRAPNFGVAVNSLAITPDGSEVVASMAFDAPDDSLNWVLARFDLASGRLLQTRPVLSGSAAYQMEFSPDGAYLALSAYAAQEPGIEVRDARTLDLVERFGNGYGAYYQRPEYFAWGPEGRLFTFSPHSGGRPGYLRMYTSSFELEASREFESRYVYEVEVSPQGLVAMSYVPAYNEAARIDLIRSNSLLSTLKTIEDAPSTGIWWEVGTLRTWSHAWPGGLGDRVRAPALRHRLSDGSRIGTSGLALYEYTGDQGYRMISGFSRIAYPNAWSDEGAATVRVSDDGGIVDVSDFNGGRWVFDLAERSLATDGTQFATSSTSRAGTEVRGRQWDVTLNGIALESLSKYPGGVPPNADVSHDGRRASFGGTWVSVYDDEGNRIWDDGAQSYVVATRFSPDGRLLISVESNGPIQWRAADTGEVILTLFVHPDREQWIAWTPSGYYDASPGGEQLLGWQVNRSSEEPPEFFPAATFRERFYRPDVVREILNTLNEADAVEIANERRNVRTSTTISETLPPTVRILSPVRNQEITDRLITVEVEIQAPDDAPADDVRLLVNGRPVPSERGLMREQEGDIRRFEVDLSAARGEDAVVTVLAGNRNGFGPPADVTVRLAGREFQEFSTAPKLYVLAVGVSDYEDDALDLSYAAKDARDVAALFEGQTGGLYREVEVRLLTDGEATQESIEDGLFWLEEQVTANDVAKIFIAGHGINDNTGELHFAPYDVDIDRLRRTGIPASDIVDTISYLQGRVVYFMDACHSGNLDFVRRSAGGVDLNALIQDLSAAENGAVVFSSAAGSQFALESPEWGNGAFTRALLQAFGGSGDYNRDGAVSVNELNLFVSEEVKRLTNNQQTPVLQKPDSIRDFPLGVVQ